VPQLPAQTKSLLFAVTLLVAQNITVFADPILTGSVEYNPASKLYTYSYTLDDTGDKGPGYNANVIYIAGPSGLSLVSHQEPNGWLFSYQSSVGDFNWSDRTGDPPSDTKLTGFTFTTASPPTLPTGPWPNYNLTYIPTYVAGGPVGDPLGRGNGIVVVPGVATAPEPRSLILCSLGSLALLGFRNFRNLGCLRR